MMLESGKMLFISTRIMKKTVLKRMVQCSLIKDCIAPPNSSVFCKFSVGCTTFLLECFFRAAERAAYQNTLRVSVFSYSLFNKSWFRVDVGVDMTSIAIAMTSQWWR